MDFGTPNRSHLDLPKISVTCVVETTEVKSSASLQVVPVGGCHSELLGSITLPFKIARLVRTEHLLERAAVLHHGLPFQIGGTQSLSAKHARRRVLPLVVGPVHAPQTWLGPDDAVVNLSGGRRETGTARIGERAAGVTISAVRPLLARSNVNLLRGATAVVAVGRATAALWAAAGVPEERIHVLPPVLNTRPGHIAPIRLREGNQASAYLLVTAGFLIQRKAIDHTIRAVPKRRRQGIDVRLEIAGTGPQEVALRGVAGEGAAAEHVVFCGGLEGEELRALYARASVYVPMSCSEYCGVAVVEAMACGLPVVSADNLGAGEVIRAEQTGWLVCSEDVDPLSLRTRRLLESPRNTFEVALEVSARVSSLFAPEVIARQWLDFYRSVCVAGPTETPVLPESVAEGQAWHSGNCTTGPTAARCRAAGSRHRGALSGHRGEALISPGRLRHCGQPAVEACW